MSLQRSKPTRIPATNREPAIRVCLVERNQLAHSYLCDIIKRNSDIQILSERLLAAPGCEDEAEPTIFAIDSESLLEPLVECLVAIRLRFPKAKMLLIGKELSDLKVPQLSFLTFHGFLSYGDVKDNLALALRVIADDGNWFGSKTMTSFPSVSRTLGGHPGTGQSDLLTHREKLIVGLAGRKMCNKEIAANLDISESTVKFHLANIFRKLGVRDRHSASLLATIAHSSLLPGERP